MTRRRRFVAVPCAVIALAAAGCAQEATDNPQSEGSNTGDAEVVLTMAWWGNEERSAATLEAVDAFTARYPHIEVKTQSSPYDNYHDTISTQLAADAAPDVMQLQAEFMAQYGAQGALLELTDVDTTLLDVGTTTNGFIDDQQVAVPTGLSTLAIVANPQIFEDAGVDMPDDETWTWEDFATISHQISENTPNGVFGTKSLGWDISEMATWVAQQGGELWTEDGKLGASTEDIASLFAFAKQLVESGAAPSASETSEQLTLSPEQSGVATGRYAMQLDAVSNFPALEAASGGGLSILRLPSHPAEPGNHHMMFVAAQYWGVSARTAHPQEAQLLVDFLSNDLDAGTILGISRSTPANSAFREALLDDLNETERAVVDFMNEVSDEVALSRLAPAGVATFTDDMQRFTLEVLFDRMAPEEAAQGLIRQTESSL